MNNKLAAYAGVKPDSINAHALVGDSVEFTSDEVPFVTFFMPRTYLTIGDFSTREEMSEILECIFKTELAKFLNENPCGV